MNKRENGEFQICLPSQVLIEFVHAVTWQHLEAPLQLEISLRIVNEYIETGVPIIGQKSTQLQTFLDLSKSITTRKKVFDVALAATLKDNGITGLYTVNVSDFKGFDFIKIVNPLIA